MTFDEKTNMYKVIFFTPYSPTVPEHFFLALVKEEDIDDINIAWGENPYEGPLFSKDLDLKRMKPHDIYDNYEMSDFYRKHFKEYPDYSKFVTDWKNGKMKKK